MATREASVCCSYLAAHVLLDRLARAPFLDAFSKESRISVGGRLGDATRDVSCVRAAVSGCLVVCICVPL